MENNDNIVMSRIAFERMQSKNEGYRLQGGREVIQASIRR